MKRSKINDIIKESDEMMKSFGWHLPPFAYFSPQEMQAQKTKIKPIINARCGWDITDFGAGDYDNMGLFLFTLRNGSLDDLKNGGGMCYAEKLLISKQDQLSPMHTHFLKAEDIINRGGAKLIIELYGSDEKGNFSESTGGVVYCDGIKRPYAAGEKISLMPGESITLRPGDWHGFWAEGGDVLIGEVSTVNDDETDNIYKDPIGRFSQIEDDVEPLHLLVSDYAHWLN